MSHWSEVEQQLNVMVNQWYDTPLPGELTDVFGLRTNEFYNAGKLVARMDGVDIAWAKVTTLGSSVVDLFGITTAGDGAAVRDEIEHDLYAVLPTPPPAKPESEAS